jgi:hypothetical protein
LQTRFWISFVNGIDKEFVVDDEQIFTDIIRWFKDDSDTSVFEIHQIKFNNQRYDYYLSKKSIVYIADFRALDI